MYTNKKKAIQLSIDTSLRFTSMPLLENKVAIPTCRRSINSKMSKIDIMDCIAS